MIFKVFFVLSLLTPWLVSAETPEERGLAVFVEADLRDSGFDDLEVDLTMILRTGRGDESTRGLRIKQLEVPEDGEAKVFIDFDVRKSIVEVHSSVPPNYKRGGNKIPMWFKAILQRNDFMRRSEILPAEVWPIQIGR